MNIAEQFDAWQRTGPLSRVPHNRVVWDLDGDTDSVASYGRNLLINPEWFAQADAKDIEDAVDRWELGVLDEVKPLVN